MENQLAIYATSLVFARLAVVAGFDYLFYLVLRPARATIRARTAQQRVERVADDRC